MPRGSSRFEKALTFEARSFGVPQDDRSSRPTCLIRAFQVASNDNTIGSTKQNTPGNFPGVHLILN